MLRTVLGRLAFLFGSISWTSFSCRIARSLYPISKGASFTGSRLETRLLAKALPQVAHGNGFSLV
jgi:hypothetical protein